MTAVASVMSVSVLRRARAPILIAASAFASLSAAHLAGLRINLSRSMPRGFYRTVSDAPSRGALVEACPPSAAAAIAKARAYLPAGTCPGDVAPLLKGILAVPGDDVVFTERGLELNGVSIPQTRPFDADLQGRTLEPHPFGSYHLAPGQYWLYSSHHPRSWDSRYFGPVDRSLIRTCVKPLWTAEAL
ncbi:MAG: conjugative transfer signal peptidase TraF [Gammaproteobacteria bacterium]